MEAKKTFKSYGLLQVSPYAKGTGAPSVISERPSQAVVGLSEKPDKLARTSTTDVALSSSPSLSI
jgi:hypothetical protein